VRITFVIILVATITVLTAAIGTNSISKPEDDADLLLKKQYQIYAAIDSRAPSELSILLADDFQGVSGDQAYHKKDVLTQASAPKTKPLGQIALTEPKLVDISPNVKVLMYMSTRGAGFARRAWSIWRMRDRSWECVFHYSDAPVENHEEMRAPKPE
jgi:hypothetical protein